MGIIIKQSIQNTIISYAGIALGFVSTILLYPNILSPDEYGLTRLLISLALICAQFAHLGINNIIIRFFPYFSESKESKRKLLTISLAVPFLGFVAFLLLYVIFEDFILSYYEERSVLYIEYYFYLVPLVFAVLFFEVLNSYARALKDSVTGSLLNEVLIRMVIIFFLVIHYFEWITFPQFMAGFVFTYSIQPVYMLIYLFRRNELALALPFKDIKRRFYKGMGVYGAYSLLGGLAMLLVGNIDIIMLSAMTDLGNTAVYAIAFYVASVISIPQRSIGKIATPLLAGFLKEKK
ncbi:MAG TPA: oligosaccharide flippase family protein, partial [Balneolaceae bacterium]|nr:oligosaccharide flippase family protein [Balneolaceae bacterium]